MDFKDRLRDEMEFQGLQGKEVAARVGISYNTFLSYVGVRAVLPNVETAVKIAEVLGVSVEYLVNGTKSDKLPDSSEEILLSNFRQLSLSNKQNLLKISEILD